MQCFIQSNNYHFHSIQHTKKQNFKGICFIFIDNLVSATLIKIGVAILTICIYVLTILYNCCF